MWQFWLIIAGVCFILEIATVGFLVFWFGVGALITMVVSLFVPNVYIQTLIFIIVSTLLIFLTKPFVNKFVNKEKPVATNAFSIVGSKAIVTKEINPILGTGQIKVAGEIWSAKTMDETVIPENTEVEINSIDGVKAVVKLISKASKENITI